MAPPIIVLVFIQLNAWQNRAIRREAMKWQWRRLDRMKRNAKYQFREHEERAQRDIWGK